MSLDHMYPWLANGAHTATWAPKTKAFIAQYLLPLFFRETKSVLRARKSENLDSEEQFWHKCGDFQLSAVNLNRFRLTDWFPRAPGVYWSRSAGEIRSLTFGTR